MHTIISSGDGWEVEVIRDDEDKTLDERLKGCTFIKLVKKSKKYLAEIRYEEKIHNQLVIVEAVVIEKNGNPLEENTLKDVKYFKRKDIIGDECKADAAEYGTGIKTEIDSRFFSD